MDDAPDSSGMQTEALGAHITMSTQQDASAQQDARARAVADAERQVEAHAEQAKAGTAGLPKPRIGPLRRLLEGPAYPLFQRKREVEQMYGRFWEQDPIYDVRSPQFDVIAFTQLLIRIERDAGVETGGVGLAFQNLSLQVPVEVSKELQTVDASAIRPFYIILDRTLRLLGIRKPVHSEMYSVINDVSGYLREGECMLILGPPGSGTSTLINMLSQRATHFSNRSGHVMFNGVDPEKEGLLMAARHLMRVVGQEDVHFASLTVLDTLGFAARCLTPDFLPFTDYVRMVRVLGVARGLGIDRVLKTPVGDATLRGVSGGEKKRVTIGEMLVGHRAKVFFLDSFNKGLDSAATLDIVKAISSFSKLLHASFVVSIQQPGSEVFDYFDKLLVLDSGRVVYFGKPHDAQKYFEALGYTKPAHRSVPDFIATVTDPKEFANMVVPGREKTAPRTSEEFEQRYKQSPLYQDVLNTLDKGVIGSATTFNPDFRRTITPAKLKIYSRRSLTPFFKQISLVLLRGFRLEMLDRRSIRSAIVAFILVGLILGTLFLSLPLNATGAYTRSGLIFLCLTFVSLSTMSNLGKKFAAVKVFKKQTAAGFYTPGPFVFASTIVDTVIIFVKALLFSICVYFLVGFQRSASRFFTFFLILWVCSLVIDAVLRVLSVFLSPDGATGAAGAVIMVFVIFSGYLIPRGQVPGWFVWIYWISPMRYAFEALSINEFYGLTFKCTTSELLPPDPTIPDSVKVCPVSTGEAYATNTLKLFSGFQWIWYDLAILFGFFFFYLIISSIGMMIIKPEQFGYRRLNDSGKPDDEEIVNQVTDSFMQSQRKLVSVTSEARSTVSERARVRPGYIVWKDITYTVPVPEGEKKLLSSVTGYCRPGKMIALMGSSGAGKTTMLDVIAQRKTKGTITGSIEVNGRPQDEYFPRISGYVEQMDLHYEKMTVRESIEFSAQLRLPESMTQLEKMEVVERTLDCLDLRSIENRVVGAVGEYGLSSEARKRLTIGVELVSNPSILFLDEPTSGLDSRAALTVTKAIRNVANLGCAVICTIHQPSIELFNQFDELLLLQRGGQTVYFGSLGKNCETLLSYFERNGAQPMEPNKNPADYMLVQIGAGLGVKTTETTQDWHETWKASPEAKRVYTLADGEATESGEVLLPPDVEPLLFESRFATRKMTQLKMTIRRAFKMAWRTPEVNFTRFVLALFQSLIFGLAFLQLPDDQTGARQAPGVLFLSALSGSLQISNVVRPLLSERAVYYRELASGYYSEAAYFVSSGVVEAPFIISGSILFSVVYYFLIGFRASRFGFFLLMNVTFSFWAVYTGQLIGALVGSITGALALPPLINTLGNVLSGFLIPRPAIPAWYIWVYWANPYQYYLQSVMLSTLSGEQYYCEPDQFAIFANPGNSTCEALSHPGFQYQAGPFPNTCEYCPRSSGDATLAFYGIGLYNKWIGVAALWGFIFLFRIITLIGLKYIKHIDR